MSNVYGIDLGTCNLKVYNKQSDQIVKEKDTIAIINKNQMYAFGDDAYAMYEKAPESIKVSFPIVSGVIADYNNIQTMIGSFLEKYTKSGLKGSEYIIAVPTDITEVEKKAFFDLFYKSQYKPKSVLLCDKPIADAIGLGLDVNEPTGIMVVDMGADTTEISVIADTRVIISKVIPVGGDRLTQDILTTIRRKLNFSISERTAGRLKVSLANLEKDTKDARKIIGIDCVSGLPRERVITSPAVNEAITPAICEIITEIRAFLERIPPQIHKVILSEGIYLTGGSTHLPYIDRVLSRQIGCPILLSHYYELCTIYGLKEIITHDALHHWAFTPKKQK